jgi:Zn ribbon nucleic-acid-binding protein
MKRLEVRYCPKCLQDRLAEVEDLWFVQITTATCTTCGSVQTEVPDPVRANPREEK